MNRMILTGALTALVALSGTTAGYAEEINATIVAGHPPVFDGVRY